MRLAAIGVEARPLSALSVNAGGQGLFLGFALPRIDEIAPAARRLAGVVAADLREVRWGVPTGGPCVAG